MNLKFVKLPTGVSVMQATLTLPLFSCLRKTVGSSLA